MAPTYSNGQEMVSIYLIKIKITTKFFKFVTKLVDMYRYKLQPIYWTFDLAYTKQSVKWKATTSHTVAPNQDSNLQKEPVMKPQDLTIGSATD